MTVYFTSDTHFGHKNIIEYTGRPWLDVPTMNDALIANWNSVVKPEDTIYHIGDFAMGPKVEHKGFMDRLNGRKILIRGNHDQSVAKMLALGFNEVHNSLLVRLDDDGNTVSDGGRLVYFAHVPTGTAPEYDIWICGHVHTAWKRSGNIINAGVDVWDYKPVTFRELLQAAETHATWPDVAFAAVLMAGTIAFST